MSETTKGGDDAPPVAKPWDHDEVTAIVTAFAKKPGQIGLFEHFPSVGVDDLISEGMIRAARVHHKWNPAKGQYNTFICNCVKRRYIDMHRSLVRASHRDTTAATARPAFVEAPDLSSTAHGEEDAPVDLADLAGRVYRATLTMAKTFGGKPVRRPVGRPPRITPAQVMALTAIKRRAALTTRGLIQLLHQRPDLRRAISLQRVPTQSWVVKKIGAESDSKSPLPLFR